MKSNLRNVAVEQLVFRVHQDVIQNFAVLQVVQICSSDFATDIVDSFESVDVRIPSNNVLFEPTFPAYTWKEKEIKYLEYFTYDQKNPGPGEAI